MVIGINIQIWASNFSLVSHQYLCWNYGSVNWVSYCPSEFINHSLLRWAHKQTAVLSSCLLIKLLTCLKQSHQTTHTHTHNLPFQQPAVVLTQRSTCTDKSGRGRNWIPTQQCIPICKWSLYGYRQKVLKPLRLSYHFLSGVSWGRRNTKPGTDECIQWTGIILNQTQLNFYFFPLSLYSCIDVVAHPPSLFF